MKNLDDHWQRKFIEKYRKDLGCNSTGSEICWCKVCVTIEKIIDDTVDHIIEVIKNQK